MPRKDGAIVFRLNKQDVDVLTSIAEYRVLGLDHLTALHDRNTQSLRRRLRVLEEQGLIQISTGGLTKHRGRPSSLVSLSDAGVELLKKRKIIEGAVPSDYVTGRSIRCLDHLLLAHEFRVQLVNMTRTIPTLSMRFLSPLSPRVPRSADGRSLVHEKLSHERLLGGRAEFTPDGVFSLTHADVGKTLLFFLEVDMGSETLVSPKGDRRDVRQKILNYQVYFWLKRYKRYERIFDAPLHGFRVLFLAHTRTRILALSGVVRDIPPSGFIWLTDRGRLLSDGVWAPIWARGGRVDIPSESILGSKIPGPASMHPV